MNIIKKVCGFIMVFVPIAWVFLGIVSEKGVMTTIITMSLVFMIIVIVSVGVWLMIGEE